LVLINRNLAQGTKHDKADYAEEAETSAEAVKQDFCGTFWRRW
jgi:hypothetical protein